MRNGKNGDRGFAGDLRVWSGGLWFGYDTKSTNEGIDAVAVRLMQHRIETVCCDLEKAKK